VANDAISSYGRGLWPTRYTAHERITFKVQARHDLRNVPLKWLWRYRDDRDENGASPDDTYYEEPDIYRRFDGPDGAHLVVDDTQKTKGSKKGVIETEGQVQVWLSRVEAMRLGTLFGNSTSLHSASR